MTPSPACAPTAPNSSGVRAGTEPPSLLDRMEAQTTLFMERFETWGILEQAYANERRINGQWPSAARPDDTSPDLSDAWRTWVADGPVRGPDGVQVSIWVRSAGQQLPFHDPPDDQAREFYTVCIRRMPAGPAGGFCSFITETSARWYAVELARMVRAVGITGMRPSDVFPERLRSARSERVLAEEIIGVRGSGHGLLRLPRRGRARWRQVRTGRR
jgi:hypothetical protein